MLNARFYDDPLLKHIKTFSVSLITAIPINNWDKVFPSTSFAVFWYFLWLQSYIVFIRKVFALILLNSVICIYIYTFFFIGNQGVLSYYSKLKNRRYFMGLVINFKCILNFYLQRISESDGILSVVESSFNYWS